MKSNKVLIIKMGHSETLAPEISRESSLGDVVRTTVLLNYFKKSDVIYWLVDEKAAPLLERNPRINKVLIWNHPEIILQLESEKFDVVINLEKTPGICALSDRIKAHRKCGFRFDEWAGVADANYHTEKVLAISKDDDRRNSANMYWQQHLARVIDKRWARTDRYAMVAPNNEEIHDIGLNYLVGSKWPDKGWGEGTENWLDLKFALEQLGYRVSLQQGTNSITEYMTWVNSCKTIITCDSLGMHLAIAYGKNVLALFGPSPSKEVYLYNQGKMIVAKGGLMSNISMSDVLDKLKEMIGEDSVEHREAGKVRV